MGVVSITPNFDSDSVRKAFEVYKRELYSQLEAMYIQIGEQFITYAQQNADFMNHTFNLRSSIGYGIAVDGQVIKTRFEQVGPGEEGVKKGTLILQNALSESDVSKGFSLIGIAGMEYAVLVEARGRDVITGASIFAERFLKNAVQSV